MAHKNYNILGVITARGGSKGIPGKNIKPLGGKPLIAYTIEAAKKSKLITHLIVSTDDPEIARVCRQYGAEVPFMRPAELATDAVKHLGVMQHAVLEMEKKLGITFYAAVVLQPTAPFRTVEDLDGTIAKLIDTGASSAVSIVEMEKSAHPIKAKKLEGDRVLPYCIPEEEGIRRQDIPPAYRRSGAAYVSRRDLLINDNRFYGDFIVGHVVPQERSIDIDTPRDWLIAEYMLADLKRRGYEF